MFLTLILIIFLVGLIFLIYFLIVVFNRKNSGIKDNNKFLTIFDSFFEKYFDFAGKNAKYDNYVKHLFQNERKYWDPAEEINLENLRKNCAGIEIKIEKLKKDPNQINRFLFYTIIVGVIFLSFISFLILNFKWYDGSMWQIVFYIFAFFLSIFFSIKFYYSSLIKDLVKLEIAKKKGWWYDPNHQQDRYVKLKSYFPEIFRKGNQGQYIEDQFWGVKDVGGKENYFHSGIFYYEIVSGSGKNRNVQRFTTNYFIFPLKKNINARFHLFPENIGSKITNFFTKKEINVESNEFNETFAFSYNGNKNEKALNIVKAISPAMQEKLINLKKQKGSCEILFADTAVVFLLKGVLLDKIKTDFTKSSDINSEDINVIENKLTELITISSEMSKYLD